MKIYRFIFIIIAFAVTTSLSAQEYSWTYKVMDGSRTGCVSPSIDNVKESLGYFKGRKYIAPNGKVHKASSSVAKTARLVIDAQSSMKKVKKVIAFSDKGMKSYYPESPLSNWFIDIIMEKVEEYAGEKVDLGITNFGGIRVDMPEGEVILDDILSMFPFKNQLIYVRHTGKELRKILSEMAASKFQVLGGVRVVAQDGRLVSAEIDGKPIEDDKIYGMATISFLLHGGDGLSLADNAVSLREFDIDIIDAVLEYVYSETEAGRSLDAEEDGRVTIN